MKTLVYIALMCSVSLIGQVPAGAIGDWPFDGNANDVSGNGNNGIVSGAIPAPDRFNQPNKAYRFDGTSSKIFVPNNTSIDVAQGTSFSFATWMKSYSSTQSGVIMAKHNMGTWNGYNFIANNSADPGYCTSYDHIYWYVAAGAQEDACSDNPIIADTLWHFLVGVYDGASNWSLLYVDNILQLDTGRSSGVSSNTADLCFGFINDPSNQSIGFFNGVLDGARLYKRVLTEAEILALYNETACYRPTAPINATTEKIICTNQSAILTALGSGTVSWYATPTSTVVLATGNTYTTQILNAGVNTFYAAVTSTCNTSLRTAITVTVSECTGIYNANIPVIECKVFPNPSNGSFILELDNSYEDAEIIIQNQIGQRVYYRSLIGRATSLELDLPDGLYLINVVNGDKVTVAKKLVIQR